MYLILRGSISFITILLDTISNLTAWIKNKFSFIQGFEAREVMECCLCHFRIYPFSPSFISFIWFDFFFVICTETYLCEQFECKQCFHTFRFRSQLRHGKSCAKRKFFFLLNWSNSNWQNHSFLIIEIITFERDLS